MSYYLLFYIFGAGPILGMALAPWINNLEMRRASERAAVARSSINPTLRRKWSKLKWQET